MLIGGIVAVAVAASVVVGVLLRRRSNDDVHSVEHYHRQLHTLEGMRAHPAGSGLREAATASSGAAAAAGGANGNGAGERHANASAGAKGSGGSVTTEVVDAPVEHDEQDEQLSEERDAAAAARPASALSASGSSTVRLTEADRPPPPPPPPPPLKDLSSPPRFDDGDAEPLPGSFMSRNDRAMDSINHRPRRLGGPLAAIAVVIVLVVILIVTGLHTTPSRSRSHSGSGTGSSPVTRPTVTTTTGHPRSRTHTTQPVTPTTAPPVVSAPSATSAAGATYTVGSPTYALALSATSGPCWVQVTDPSTGSVLLSTTLYGGQSHTVTATGPLSVQVGAPNSFTATVDGTPVTLPAGFQAPFTLKFQTAAGSPPA